MKARTVKPHVPLEAEIQRSALRWLEANGIPAWRRNVITVPIPATATTARRFVRAAEKGQSDIWGVIPADRIAPDGKSAHLFGRHFEAEVKRPGERPTLDQVRWLERLNAITGGAAFWFDRLEILERVMRCLRAGGVVEYLGTQRKYGKIWGPSGDYDIVWPDID